MPPFECDNIMYKRDHKLTEDKYNANTIAEAVVVWGISNEFDDIDDSIDDYYHLETLEQLNIIISTVINFTNVFEFEFEQLFSKHCNENMSEKQFIEFVDTRCNLLGTLEGYFGCILPCAFVREIIFRFKNHFECSHFCILAQQCLAKFLGKKFMELKKERSFDGFMNYCSDINDKFLDKVHCKFMSSNESYDEHFCMEPPNTIKNADTIVKSTEQNDANEFQSYGTANDTMGKIGASNVDRTDSATISLHNNSGNYRFDELSNGTILSEKKSDAILELSVAISEMCFEDEKEWCKADEKDTFDSEMCFEDEKEWCKADEKDTVDSKMCFEDEKEHYKADEKDVNDSVCSFDSSYDSSFDNSCTNEDKELTEMYNIIMPDREFVEDVFNRIEDCFDNEENRAKLEENCGLESDNLNDYSENKLTFPSLPKRENLHDEIPTNKDSLDNMDFLTTEPYERKYCIQCKTSVYSS